LDKKALKITEDGSHTLLLPHLNESYHSIHGAIQESKHIFINDGLNFLNKSEINILEIGFGTGLNAYLSLLESINKEYNIFYTAIEKYPLSLDLIKQLNYPQQLKTTLKQMQLFTQLHKVGWGAYQKTTKNFKIKKINVSLANFKATEQFNLIYFDAFSPQVQPEMWSNKVFKKMYSCLVNDGILLTYCAKGSVKRTLKEVGFTIENIPGPPGKREITRAFK